MIPDEAVQAARKEIMRALGGPYMTYEQIAQAVLEAALPYLSEAAKQPQRDSPTDWPDVPRLP